MKTQPINNHSLWRSYVNGLSQLVLSPFSRLAACSLMAISCVRQAILHGLTASWSHLTGQRSQHLTLSKRHLVGFGLLVAGLIAMVLHQLLFTPTLYNHDVCRVLAFSTTQCQEWCYVNWFYFYFTIRPYVLLIIWSAAFLLFTPTKYRLAWVPFSLVNSLGWIGLLHYTLSVTSHDTFHMMPESWVIVAALSAGISFTLGIDYLVYRHEHLFRGNMARIIGVIEVPDIPYEQKDVLLRGLAQEARNINGRV